MGNKPQYHYKTTSLKFEKVNKFVRNFLKKTPAGFLIHPEYSTYCEDHSYLAVEGKLMKLQYNQSGGNNQQIPNT